MAAPKVIEVALVANLQTMGPTYIASASENIFDHGAGMLLAARIVITSSMGSHISGLRELNGPIPISELELENEYLCYYYPVEMKQLPLPDMEITRGKGVYVFCVIISQEDKTRFKTFETILDRIIQQFVPEISFSDTFTGEVPESMRTEVQAILSKLHGKLNSILEFASQFEGGSLYNVGLIASLPEDLSYTAKKIMLNPTKGILEEEIQDKNALSILYQVGLVLYEDREDQRWVVPR